MTGIPKKYGKACANLILILAIIFGCIFIAPKIILLFMPFIIGGILAWIASPVVRFLEKKIKIGRRAGSVLVIVSVIAGIGFLIYSIGNRLFQEVLKFLRTMPKLWSDMEIQFVGFKRMWSGIMETLPQEMVGKVDELGQNMRIEAGVWVGELSTNAAGIVGEFAGQIPDIVIAAVMCLLSVYFFEAEKDYVLGFLKQKVSDSQIQKCVVLKQTTVDVMTGYLKAQFKIEIWIYLVVCAGLLLIKVPYGYLIAIPIAFLDVLPVFGTGTVLIPWAIFKLLTGEYLYALALVIIWGISQLVRQLIQPKVIGKSMGLDMIPTLILLYVGYKLAGVIGMIAAVPIGMLVLSMNETGFFDNSKKSIGILWHGVHEFRQFTNEELEESKNNETKL